MKVREQPESLLLNPRRAAVLLGIGWVAFRDLLKRGEIAVVPTGKNRVKVPRVVRTPKRRGSYTTLNAAPDAQNGRESEIRSPALLESVRL